MFPMTKPNRKFCTDNCKTEYNRYGAAYGPLRDKLTKLIAKRVNEETKEIKKQIADLRVLLLAPAQSVEITGTSRS